MYCLLEIVAINRKQLACRLYDQLDWIEVMLRHGLLENMYLKKIIVLKFLTQLLFFFEKIYFHMRKKNTTNKTVYKKQSKEKIDTNLQ